MPDQGKVQRPGRTVQAEMNSDSAHLLLFGARLALRLTKRTPQSAENIPSLATTPSTVSPGRLHKAGKVHPISCLEAIERQGPNDAANCSRPASHNLFR